MRMSNVEHSISNVQIGKLEELCINNVTWTLLIPYWTFDIRRLTFKPSAPETPSLYLKPYWHTPL